MTERRIAPANIRSMTVSANEFFVPVDLSQLVIEIFSQSGFIVAFSATGNRNVRLQSFKRSCFRDVDMTSRAFGKMILLFTSAFMFELH